MAGTKEIKSRINSIKDTQKITNAMYLIASTKMRKAKSELDHTRPFFNALQGEMKRLFRIDSSVNSKYFYPVGGEPVKVETCGLLVVTADKGLAGAYNQNVIKEAAKVIEMHPDTKLFVVGEYGRQYYMRHKIPIEKSFLYTAQNPTMQRAREISELLLSMYDREELGRIYIVYTDLKSSLSAEAKTTRLLPFHRSNFVSNQEEEPIKEPFEFYPSIEKVLDNCARSYVTGFIYSALVDSFCSEQNARMTAMSSANDNAEEILEQLSIQYNRVRQAAITREITEVSAGAKAQRKKRLKRKENLRYVNR